MIPPRIRITPKVTYEVRWTESFRNPKQYGECCPNTKTIVLLLGLSPSETFWTFWHEVMHAVSFEGDRELYEKDVEMLEQSWRKIAELNSVEKGFLSLFEKANLPPTKSRAHRAMKQYRAAARKRRK